MSVNVTIVQNGTTTVATSTTQPSVSVSVAATVGPQGEPGEDFNYSLVELFVEADDETVNWDFADGNVAELTLEGDWNLGITNAPSPSFGTLKIIQDETGGRTLTLPGVTEDGFSLSVNPGGIDILHFSKYGSDYYWAVDNYEAIPEGDADANAFIAAAGIVDGTQTAAIQTLVDALKDAGVWTKMTAIYPFVGGTATTHKFNLKNPLDTDGAYRLSFVNGATHNNNGVEFNGSTQYANTFIDATVDALMAQDSSHLSMYVRTEGNTSDYDMGAEGQTSVVIRLLVNVGGTMYAGINDNGQTTVASPGTRKGHYISTRTISTEYKVFRNGTLFHTRTTTSTGETSVNKILIGAQSSGSEGVGGYSSKQFAFATVGSGLSDAECLALYNAVNAFQTSLSRNV